VGDLTKRALQSVYTAQACRWTRAPARSRADLQARGDTTRGTSAAASEDAADHPAGRSSALL